MNNDYKTKYGAQSPDPYADKPAAGFALFRTRKPRISGLDFLRGLCIILMMFDHLAFDLMWLPYWSTNFYRINNAFLVGLQEWVSEFWWTGTLRMTLRLTVITIFFTISGICSSFSENNGLRGLKVGVAAAVLSLVTMLGDRLFDLGIGILFGVLHCFTVSILLYALLRWLLKDKSKYACLGLGILLIVWGILIDFYTLQDRFDLTDQAIGFVDFLGIMAGVRYYGADCFGILPYTGIFLLGAYGGAELYKHRKPYLPIFDKRGFAPVCFVGRKAVWFYLLHQPVILALVVILSLILGIRFF